MARVHGISRKLAAYHVAQMEDSELLWRREKYAEMELSAGVAVGARPSEIRPNRGPQTGETEGQRIRPLNAIAVRSPSGGGGGGVAVCRVAEPPSGERGF
jgi:hypothetical protein